MKLGSRVRIDLLDGGAPVSPYSLLYESGSKRLLYIGWREHRCDGAGYFTVYRDEVNDESPKCWWYRKGFRYLEAGVLSLSVEFHNPKR